MRVGARTIVVLGVVLAACDKDAGEPAPPAASAVVSVPVAAEPGALLEAGDEAPEVEAVAHTGQRVRLADHRGKPVVVYFYPKDDTPGCTVEAQSFRDEWRRLRQAGVVVLGVSTDDNVSHRAFASKYELPFLLLPDTDQKIARAFGVPLANGHAKRVTFVIDTKGRIAKTFADVTPKGHAEEVVAAVSELES